MNELFTSTICNELKSGNKIVIFDLDGTLSDMSHRLPLVTNLPKRWRLFFLKCIDDKPIINNILMLKLLSELGVKIYIWSGRDNSVLKETKFWLNKYGIKENVNYHDLRLRPAGDPSEDTVIKKSWYDSLTPSEKENILFVFEDRKIMVDMWRSLGLTCYQVADAH